MHVLLSVSRTASASFGRSTQGRAKPNILLYFILCPGFANAGSRHLEWARQLPPRVHSLGKRLVELQVILSADSCAVNNGSIF